MARPIVLSNGELHVGLNMFGLVHDFYFPYVGLENHSAGEDLRHKIGVYIDGQISWLNDNPDWTFSFSYPHTALIGHTKASNDKLQVILEFDDTVDAVISAFMRNIHVINTSDRDREIRLFTHQAFAIGDSRSNTDTAQYLPDSDAILHYRGRRAFVISGCVGDEPFDQHSIGLFGIEGHDGTYRDAEDGELSDSNVEHGRVDSTLRFKLDVPAHNSTRVHYWIAAGKSMREALYVHNQIKDDGMMSRLHATAAWWHSWLKPAITISEKIPPAHRETFLHSVMIIKSQIDKRGAVIASTDTSMLNYSRDAYAYCWPRDGAFVLWPLIRMGYTDEAYRFFEFCKQGLHPAGYLMHKYRADGALGSSWHPYVQDGTVAPPIQEDETALVLFVFAQYYKMHPDSSLMKDFYEPMIKPMANFMLDYTDDLTGLPRPSYDLWEQSFLTTTYTVSIVYAALLAAADLANTANDSENAVRWKTAADDIQIAAKKHLYNADRNSFYNGVIVKDGELQKVDIIDTSSTFGAFMFGLFTAESSELQSSVRSITDIFGHSDTSHGLPRYENDDYRRARGDITGNWWFITSLWLAQYYLDQDKRDEAFMIINWVQSCAMNTGIMSEQADPITGEIISPAPLTWTQAEYVSTLLDSITLKGSSNDS